MTEKEELAWLESYRKAPFLVLADAETDAVANALKGENARISAICVNALMSHTWQPINKGAALLSALDEDVRKEVVIMLASDDWLRRITVSEEDRALLYVKSKLLNLSDDEIVSTAEAWSIAAMISYLTPAEASFVLKPLQRAKPDLYKAVAEHLFFFEDIALLQKDAISRALADINWEEIVKALHGADSAVINRIAESMGEEARDRLYLQLKTRKAPAALTKNQKQQRILSILRRLEETGDITLPPSVQLTADSEFSKEALFARRQILDSIDIGEENSCVSADYVRTLLFSSSANRIALSLSFLPKAEQLATVQVLLRVEPEKTARVLLKRAFLNRQNLHLLTALSANTPVTRKTENEALLAIKPYLLASTNSLKEAAEEIAGKNAQKPQRLATLLSLLSPEKAAPCLAALTAHDSAMANAVKSRILRFSDTLRVPDSLLSKLFAGKWNNTASYIAPAVCTESREIQEKFCRALGRARTAESAKHLRALLAESPHYSAKEIRTAQERLLIHIHGRLK